MSIFVCDKCGCIDNTATGFYWMKDRDNCWEDKNLNKKALCCECAPSKFKDGSNSGYGKWHNKFPKVKWDGKREVINRKKQGEK